MTDGLILEGDLQDISLPTLLMSLYKDKETGILSVEVSGYSKSIYIKEGNVVFATSKCPDDRLGESLLRKGKITVKDYFITSSLLKKGGKRLGEILVDRGILSSEEMVLGVKEQLTEIIYSLFSLTKGNYRLEFTDFSTEEWITLSIEMPNLIYKGMKKSTSWKNMYAIAGPLDTRVRKNSELPSFFSSIEFTPDEEHIISLANNPIAIENLLEISYLPQYETYNIIAILITLQIFLKESPLSKTSFVSSLSDEEIIDEFNDVFSLIFHKLNEKAEKIFFDAYKILSETHKDLLENQQGIYGYGRIDPDALILKLKNYNLEERTNKLIEFLKETFYIISFFAKPNFNDQTFKEIEEYIKNETKISKIFGEKK